MFGLLANGLAALSIKLRQPLSSFCDLETSDGPALVGKRGENVTVLQARGLRKMTLRQDVEAIAVASTAPAAAAPLGEILRMLPWGRPASPWQVGSVLFRTPDGRMWPFDPAGSRRKHTLDLFVAPSRFGRSVLSNTIPPGLCLSSAAQTTQGAKLPLIGKLDIGPSAEGLILLIQEALPARRRGEAISVAMRLAEGYELNIFDTQIGCRTPLPLEKDFVQNLLSLGCMPIDAAAPFEGMDQLVGFVVEMAYRMVSDSSSGKKRPKRYQPGVEPGVDAALRRLRFAQERDTWWWEAHCLTLIAAGARRCLRWSAAGRARAREAADGTADQHGGTH